MFMNWFRKISFPLKIRLLSKACDRIRRLPPGESPGWLDVTLLALAWGNLGYAAGFSYLRHVGDRVRATGGMLLECGSGATTLLVGALTQQSGRSVCVLEHDREWFEYLSKVTEALDFTHLRIVYAPLKSYGDFSWYDLSGAKEPLQTGKVGMVICDGPPGDTPGGRYGLMPVMGDYLARNCLVLLDDTHRPAEQRILASWGDEWCLDSGRQAVFRTYTEIVACK